METSKKDWETKLNNLHSRSKGISSEHQIDYKKLLKGVFIGKLVLDVGCGTCWLKKLIPKESQYVGIDVYEKEEQKDVMFKNVNIEDLCWSVDEFDTVFVFAALDGMRDLSKALQNIKNIAIKNIVILTGVNIEPDLYHTHLITEDFIDQQMSGLNKTVRVQVHPKIVFLEYTKTN